MYSSIREEAKHVLLAIHTVASMHRTHRPLAGDPPSGAHGMQAASGQRHWATPGATKRVRAASSPGRLESCLPCNNALEYPRLHAFLPRQSATNVHRSTNEECIELPSLSGTEPTWSALLHKLRCGARPTVRQLRDRHARRCALLHELRPNHHRAYTGRRRAPESACIRCPTGAG